MLSITWKERRFGRLLVAQEGKVGPYLKAYITAPDFWQYLPVVKARMYRIAGRKALSMATLCWVNVKYMVHQGIGVLSARVPCNLKYLISEDS